MSYSVEYTLEAVSDLENLAASVQKRIINKINWLAENFDHITPQPLTANLSGFYKLRIGDYRVIYEFSQENRIIFIDKIRHRRDAYN